jgi:hypothetical protein
MHHRALEVRCRRDQADRREQIRLEAQSGAYSYNAQRKATSYLQSSVRNMMFIAHNESWSLSLAPRSSVSCAFFHYANKT